MEDFHEIPPLKSFMDLVLARLAHLESAHADLQTSHADLQTRYCDLDSSYTDLEARYALLEAENADLRNQLKLNSTNSHKPPSSDGLTKKPAIGRPKGGKSGGQVGHAGKSLKFVSEPDHTLIHHLSAWGCKITPL